MTRSETLTISACEDVLGQRNALAQDVLSQFGTLRVRAFGGSMLPNIVPGDELTFHCRARTTPRPGQVVLYRRGSRLIAHRLRARAGHEWLIRGDSAPDEDDLPVADTDLVGVLASHRRGARILDPDRAPRRLPYFLRRLMRNSMLAHRAMIYCCRLVSP